MDFPFAERQVSSNCFLREFNKDVDSEITTLLKHVVTAIDGETDKGKIRKFIDEEFLWHMDREDRYVTVKSGSNWKLQMDNELPVLLEMKKVYFIPKFTYHRIIKGSTKLIIEVKKII